MKAMRAEVRDKELDGRTIGGRALEAVGAPFEDSPRLRLRRAEELVQETRLAHPRFRADRRDLALAASRQLEQRVQPLELGAPPDESRELLAVGGPELRSCRRPADELGDL